MNAKRITYKILMIDDDSEMNVKLHRLLSGRRVIIQDIEYQPVIEFINVDLEGPIENGYFRIHGKTITELKRVSAIKKCNLVMIDFGFADEVAKDILWENRFFYFKVN